jgi:hypothetical protein
MRRTRAVQPCKVSLTAGNTAACRVCHLLALSRHQILAASKAVCLHMRWAAAHTTQHT